MILAELLERDGFPIRGRRADCPFCEAERHGHGRGTVAFTQEVAFCHRCKWTANVRTLSRKLGVAVAPETASHREARRLGQEFAAWVNGRERILLAHHRYLWRRAGLAHIALSFFPDWERAWEVLAECYDNEARLCAALDALCFEQAGRWLEEPTTPEKLFRSWQRESHART